MSKLNAFCCPNTYIETYTYINIVQDSRYPTTCKSIIARIRTYNVWWGILCKACLVLDCAVRFSQCVNATCKNGHTFLKVSCKHNTHMCIPTDANIHTQYLHKIVHARPRHVSPHGRHYSKWALNEIGHTNGVLQWDKETCGYRAAVNNYNTWYTHSH